MPRSVDRDTYPEWIRNGKKDALNHACARMEEILASSESTQLTEDQDKALNQVLEEARNYYRQKGLMNS